MTLADDDGRLPDRAAPLLRVDRLTKVFEVRTSPLSGKNLLRAVNDVSLYVRRGETLGLVGESGSGKTTLARTILGLVEPTVGRVVFDGVEITRKTEHEVRPLRRRMQIIFQDPNASLDPRMTAGNTIAEAIRVHRLVTDRGAIDARVTALLEKVGLRPDDMHRRPHEFSGGQRQRIGIARALAAEPSFIVCDDPVSALDPSVEARVVNLLLDLQEELALSYLFVSHDLRVVEFMSQRVAVMYLGRIVETGPTASLFERRLHPYTRALISATPTALPSRKKLQIVLDGEPGDALDPPRGCAFHPRCPRALAGTCNVELPRLRETDRGSGHRVACWNPHV